MNVEGDRAAIAELAPVVRDPHPVLPPTLPVRGLQVLSVRQGAQIVGADRDSTANTASLASRFIDRCATTASFAVLFERRPIDPFLPLPPLFPSTSRPAPGFVS